MPNFNGEIISGVSKVSSQALGCEWERGGGITDNDDCSYDESYCSVCNDCYDSYNNSSCPTCCTIRCDECGYEYSCSGSHECKESGSNVEKNVQYAVKYILITVHMKKNAGDADSIYPNVYAISIGKNK